MKLVVCSWCDGESMLGDEVCPQCFGEAVYHVDNPSADANIVPCACPLCCMHTNVTEAGQCAACKAWLTLDSIGSQSDAKVDG